MKTKEELNKKLAELTDEELKQVTGGENDIAIPEPGVCGHHLDARCSGCQYLDSNGKGPNKYHCLSSGEYASYLKDAV